MTQGKFGVPKSAEINTARNRANNMTNVLFMFLILSNSPTQLRQSTNLAQWSTLATITASEKVEIGLSVKVRPAPSQFFLHPERVYYFTGSIPEKIRTVSLITEQFLDALALVESSGNAAAVGDGGRARGPFQFWREAWQDADRKLKLNKSFELYATDPAVSRLYARAHLATLETRLAAVLRCPPSAEQLYAAWNLGLTGFERRGFLLSRCPQTTQRAAAKLKGLL
jgi:hypothetical protein